MTSNTTPSGVVSASNNDASFPPWCAMDRNTNTAWITNAGITSAWIQYNPSIAEICVSYSMTTYTSYVVGMPNTWTFEASNTGAFAGEQITLDSQTGITWTNSEKKVFSLSNTDTYAYYRVNVTSVNGDTKVRIAEIEMLGIIIAKSNVIASLTVTAQSKAINRSAITATATVLSEAQRKSYKYSFIFVQEIQISSITQHFHFVEKLEQLSSSISIQRVNV